MLDYIQQLSTIMKSLHIDKVEVKVKIKNKLSYNVDRMVIKKLDDTKFTLSLEYENPSGDWYSSKCIGFTEFKNVEDIKGSTLNVINNIVVKTIDKL